MVKNIINFEPELEKIEKHPEQDGRLEWKFFFKKGKYCERFNMAMLQIACCNLVKEGLFPRYIDEDRRMGNLDKHDYLQMGIVEYSGVVFIVINTEDLPECIDRKIYEYEKEYFFNSGCESDLGNCIADFKKRLSRICIDNSYMYNEKGIFASAYNIQGDSGYIRLKYCTYMDFADADRIYKVYLV